MSMERWNPFRDMDTMRQAMDRWMDDRLGSNWLGMNQGNMGGVALDVHETENGYELEASVPGFKSDELDVSIDRDTVTIRGQSQSNDERREGKNYLYRERRSGTFVRSIRLPEPIDGERVEATLDHGVLRLQLPRLAATQRRRVQVRAGQMGGQMATNQGMMQSDAATSATSGMSGSQMSSQPTDPSSTMPGSIGSQMARQQHEHDTDTISGQPSNVSNQSSTGQSMNSAEL